MSITIFGNSDDPITTGRWLTEKLGIDLTKRGSGGYETWA